jgi:hypothetical protein
MALPNLLLESDSEKMARVIDELEKWITTVLNHQSKALPEFNWPSKPTVDDIVYDLRSPLFAHLACAAFRAISSLCSALNF